MPVRRSLPAALSASLVVALLTALAMAALALIPRQAHAAEPERVLRLGYQKYGTLVLLKARGTLESRLAGQGWQVRWTEFPAGPALLEAIHVGSIDAGLTGEAPPIFAQAAGAELVYVGAEPPEPTGEAIVVAKDSPLRAVAELKGKRIALNKGSNVHYLLVRLLERAGLRYGDVEPVFLPPADARAAFERGAVDAWAIWDPFLAAAQEQIGARVLADGTGAVANRPYYLADRRFAEVHADIVGALLDELNRTGEWARQRSQEVAAQLAPSLGLATATVARSLSRKSWGVAPVGPEVLADQQRIADTFLALKLIPAPIDVSRAVARPAPKTAQTGR
jgi:sulfonate transport system substrate-binding protein